MIVRSTKIQSLGWQERLCLKFRSVLLIHRYGLIFYLTIFQDDPFYGLRVLLSEMPIPEKLDESEFQMLVANSGETDLLSSITNPPFDSMKKKVKKAQIARELLEDISSEYVC